MIALKINQISFIVKEEISILDACKLVGIKIPRFCYHDTLSIAGSCRMCLVKLELDDKLLVSCVTEVESDMEIVSNDPLVQKVREEILEFLLLDHPLDCPICDQAGECDLQDHTKSFGSNFSKYSLNKVGVEDKNFGVFIKSIMTRCIHCTRCVRFSSEIAGIDFFGTLNRGNSTEIGTFVPTLFNSEISGNVVDLCPVGALTSKPYAFKSRPWEVKSLETIDLTDSLGTNIYTHFIGSRISRIIPKFNSEINDTIISDKARYSYDSISSSNTLQTFLEFSESKEISHSSLEEFYYKIKFNLKKKRILIVISDELNFQVLNLLKKISFSKNNVEVRQISSTFYIKKSNLFFNLTNNISSIQDALNFVLLVAVNPRTEVALLNTRLRFLSLNNYFKIYSCGLKFESNLNNSFLNLTVKSVLNFISGKSREVSSLLISSESPLILFGNSIFERGVNIEKFRYALKTMNPSAIFLGLATSSNTSGSTYLNFKGLSLNDISKSEVVFFFKCRETAFLKKNSLLLLTLKPVYWFSNYILDYPIRNGYLIPIKNIFEEAGVYLNLEFRPQWSKQIINNKINSRSAFSVLKFLFDVEFVLSTHSGFLKNFLKVPSLFSFNLVNLNYSLNFPNSYFLNSFISKYPFKQQQNDFFKTNYYTDFSQNMLNASRSFQKSGNNFF
jgi:NADH dehydrogenase (ubiquinone) Fe-S protein 1